MANKVELSAGQLASLDLLIKSHRDNPDFLTDVIDCVVHATPVVETALLLTEAIGESAMQGEKIIGDLKTAKNASLEQLIELRNSSILKK